MLQYQKIRDLEARILMLEKALSKHIKEEHGYSDQLRKFCSTYSEIIDKYAYGELAKKEKLNG